MFPLSQHHALPIGPHSQLPTLASLSPQLLHFVAGQSLLQHLRLLLTQGLKGGLVDHHSCLGEGDGEVLSLVGEVGGGDHLQVALHLRHLEHGLLDRAGHLGLTTTHGGLDALGILLEFREDEDIVFYLDPGVLPEFLDPVDVLPGEAGVLELGVLGEV